MTDKNTNPNIPMPASKVTPATPNSFTTVSEASTTSPAAKASLSDTGSTSSSSGAASSGSASAGSASSGSMSAGKDSTAKDKAGNAAHEAKEHAGSMAQDMKAKAGDLADSAGAKARSMASGRIDDAKEYASGEIDRTAERVRAAGADLGGEYPAKAADYIAGNLHYAADMVRDADFGTVADDLTHFARRNPAMFLGGAALLGFAIARLMKASDRSGGYGR